MLAKVLGEPDLFRDENGVIHNKNTDDFRAYIARRNTAQETKKRIDNLEKQNAELNDKLDLILQMLRDKK